MKREENWCKHYQELKAYIAQHGQLPDKKKEEHRALLNWWKYNRKLIKRGQMDADKARLLEELGNSRLIHR